MLIFPYAGSHRHGMALRPYYLAREWVKLGHEVTIVASGFSHLRLVNPDNKDGLTEEMIDGIRYLWIKTPRYTGNGSRRVLNMLGFAWLIHRYAPILSERYRPDLVMVSSPHPFSIFGAKRVARSARAKLVFEVRDLWPQSLIEYGNRSAWHPFIILTQFAENYAYSVSDQIVSLLPKAEEHMRLHGLAQGKFYYLPNGIVVEEWEESGPERLPDLHRETLQRWKEEGRFIIGYAGSHGLANRLEDLIEAADELRDQPVAFVLVGQGPMKAALEQLVEEKGLRHVSFLPPIPKTAIPACLRWMDALFMGWKMLPLLRFGVSANKLFDYMMAGKPVIHAIDAGNDPIEEAGCGISIRPEDSRQLVDAIRRLLKMTEKERQEMGQRGRSYVMEMHNLEHLASRFLTDVCGQPQHVNKAQPAQPLHWGE
ncbi:glycosyltransferase family 4 protein [Brevibacillus ruminantium]|uniref:Glycosyltransferase family 4 protein n=1 Tax=Brevibacillus ruminantium TaxID=2950604 RepID=A0ABY4WNX3_9BACL|nr:glycosyltransferase family 4 protein [Brevibacillus ruminantium]USG68369.1 glycosyltransferase family 4 protein [Brevibacillus ruminantium]